MYKVSLVCVRLKVHEAYIVHKAYVVACVLLWR